ncbi:MAG: lysozyme inhibitor LprI family protein [Brachymonas sp.]|nr:lysozyme inhibitor LprI family protein [Brachymonas sp.]
MKKSIALLALLTPFMASANSNCDKPVNDFDGLYCLNKVYVEADKELNARYKELMPFLDSSGKSALKRGQLAWIRQRNNECSRREGNNFFVNLDCAARQTIERVQFLQDRLRECKSSGCLNSRL